MKGAIWMVGGDARSAWTAQSLRSNGLEVKTFGVPQQEDSPLPKQFPILLLPYPSFSGALVRGKAAVPVEELLCRADGLTHVYGAQFGIWKEGFESRGAQVTELYGSEPLTTANAVPTAEGAIELAMAQSDITLYGARCLVIGYGRIGKVLSQRLHALGASVTVTARKGGDLALAESLGLSTDLTGRYLHGLGQYDFVFNTVPSSILSDSQLEQLSRDCILIELASAPGGFCAETCQARGLRCLLASGLPAKCAPKTAGALYAQSILPHLEEL